MRPAVDTILNAILSRQPADKRSRLTRFLPENVRKRLEALPEFEPNSINGFSNGDMLKSVHWSWFLPTLKSYDLPEVALFLSCFDVASAKNLAAEIPCKKISAETTAIGRSYLKDILMKSLVSEHDRLIPIDYLPASPLNQILNLKRNRLIDLIDLLAMHDLAIEIRQIVETKMLKKIYSFLSGGQRQFLKLIKSKHEVLPHPKIGLDQWDGKEESLRRLLHRQGLARLGSALSTQDASLVWYVCHVIDIGRGSLLFKLCGQEKNRKAADTAARQVEELLGKL